MREPGEIKQMLRHYMETTEDKCFKYLAEEAFMYIAYIESKTEAEKELLEEERRKLRGERMHLSNKILALAAIEDSLKYVIKILEEEQNEGNQKDA